MQSVVSAYNDLAAAAADAETKLSAAEQLKSSFDSATTDLGKWLDDAEEEVVEMEAVNRGDTKDELANRKNKVEVGALVI